MSSTKWLVFVQNTCRRFGKENCLDQDGSMDIFKKCHCVFYDWQNVFPFSFLFKFSNPMKKRTNLHNKTNYRSIITSSCSKMMPLSKWPFSFISVEIIMCWVRYLLWLTLIQTSTGWLSISSCPWARNITFESYSWINMTLSRWYFIQ